MRDKDYCGVISARNLELPVKEAFNIERVELFEVPGCRIAPNGMNAKLSHYPERFNELKRALKVPLNGAPFLIGAGLFGKTYCHWIKERGGIALDVGSEVGAFYWTVPAPDIVNSGREEQGSVSV
jgi:hypothetical protein